MSQLAKICVYGVYACAWKMKRKMFYEEKEYNEMKEFEHKYERENVV